MHTNTCTNFPYLLSTLRLKINCGTNWKKRISSCHRDCHCLKIIDADIWLFFFSLHNISEMTWKKTSKSIFIETQNNRNSMPILWMEVKPSQTDTILDYEKCTKISPGKHFQSDWLCFWFAFKYLRLRL